MLLKQSQTGQEGLTHTHITPLHCPNGHSIISISQVNPLWTFPGRLPMNLTPRSHTSLLLYQVHMGGMCSSLYLSSISGGSYCLELVLRAGSQKRIHGILGENELYQCNTLEEEIYFISCQKLTTLKLIQCHSDIRLQMNRYLV